MWELRAVALQLGFCEGGPAAAAFLQAHSPVATAADEELWQARESWCSSVAWCFLSRAGPCLFRILNSNIVAMFTHVGNADRS
jgi:hypothetical protein